MVTANAMWKVVFQRLLQHLMRSQEASGCTLYTCTTKTSRANSFETCSFSQCLNVTLIQYNYD